MDLPINDIGYTSQFLKALHDFKIYFYYLQDDDNSWGVFTDENFPGQINTYGIGNTFDEAVDDYVIALKEIAESIYLDGLGEAEKIMPLFLMKVLMVNNEELKKCLVGRNCEDI